MKFKVKGNLNGSISIVAYMQLYCSKCASFLLSITSLRTQLNIRNIQLSK